MKEQHFGHIEHHELVERRKTWVYFAIMAAAIVLVVLAVLVSIT